MHQHERGISLVLTLLIAGIILLIATSVGVVTLQALRSSQAQSDAVRVLYGAEDAFACVRYAIDKDNTKELFSDPSTAAATQFTCNGITYTINGGAATDPVYTTPNIPPYNNNTGLTTFTIPYDATQPGLGEVTVEVLRNLSTTYFDGTIRVYSDSETGTSKTVQRFQEYQYAARLGSDIMFVVDRSGSIDGTRTSGSESGEWLQLLTALDTSINVLNAKAPSPHIGIVSFGSSTSDVGMPSSPDAGTGVCTDCALIPQVILQSGLADSSGMQKGITHTNLSLGLAVAGAELMGKYYPIGDLTDPVNDAGGTPVLAAGRFEELVHDTIYSGATLSSGLLNQSPQNNDQLPDIDYPDFIIIITDGEPNGIMSYISQSFDQGQVDASNAFISVGPYTYQLGDAKLFRTTGAGAGTLIIDDPADAVSSPASSYAYRYCDDSGVDAPTSFPGWSLTGPQNDVPYMAMCNSTMIARALQSEGITFGAIGVGVGATSVTEEWLKDLVGTNGVYVSANNYADLSQSILTLLGKLQLTQSR